MAEKEKSKAKKFQFFYETAVTEEERRKHIKEVWEGILKAVPKMESGTGLILYGDCGLRRRIVIKRKFKIFTLDKATW